MTYTKPVAQVDEALESILSTTHKKREGNPDGTCDGNAPSTCNAYEVDE